MAWARTFAVWALLAAVAHAQPNPQQTAQAEALFNQGTQLFDGHAYARAEAAWRQAWSLMAGHPNRPFILVNVGRAVDEQMGREAEALQIYEQVLAETANDERPNAQTARRLATERLAELRARLSHRGGGGLSDLQMIGLIGTAVGGAALIASLITAIAAHSIYESLGAACPMGGCPPERAGDIGTGGALGIASTVFLFAGGAIALGGLGLLLFGGGGGGGARAAGAPSVRVAWLGTGLSLEGSW